MCARPSLYDALRRLAGAAVPADEVARVAATFNLTEAFVRSAATLYRKDT